MLSVLRKIFILTAVLTFHIAFVPALSVPMSLLNVVLVFLIFISVVYEFYHSLAYGLVMGLFLDLYSALPFGAMLLSLMITLYVVYKVFQHLLTNKSFYTLLGLTGLATIVYNLVLYFYLLLFYFVQTKDKELLVGLSVQKGHDFLWQLLLNLVFAALLFFVFNSISRKFKAVFIEAKRN